MGHPEGLLLRYELGRSIECGQYAIESDYEKNVEANDGVVCSEDWFESPVLCADLIARIRSVRLITESHDQGRVSEPFEGNWTWFELGIVNANSTNREERELRWRSHENGFMTTQYGWRQGRVFSQRHHFLKSLKDGCRIQVRVCARFKGWINYARKSYLVFDIGCETFNRQPISLPRPDNPRNISIRTKNSILGKLLGENDEGWTVSTLSPNGDPHIDLTSNTEPKLRIYETKHVSAFKDHSKIPRLVVVDVCDFGARKDVDINHLSWDRIVEDVWKIMNENTATKSFHLIIRFGYEGAIYKSPKHDLPTLVYEPGSAEGQFLQSYSDQDLKTLRTNRVTLRSDLNTAWLAGLTASLAKESDSSICHLCETQIKEAIITSICWSRRFAAIKYPKGGTTQQTKATWHSIKCEPDSDPILVPIRVRNLKDDGRSSLIFQSLPYRVDQVARDIVKKGQDVLSFVPTARFGNLVTADRDEIDGFREIANSVDGYIAKRETKPLSIAVFGQPGSGKSFGVKQVIKTILKSHGRPNAMLEFNLSQFQDESDLQTAFETVRDRSMLGELPVVFFDEFDVTFNGKPLYWVKHFLSPIEDGVSLLGNQRQLLGEGIYIFIGGTAKTFADFKMGIAQDGKQLGSEISDNPIIHLRTSHLARCLDEFISGDTGLPVEKVHMSVTLQPTWEYSKLQETFYSIREFTSSGKMPVVFFRDFDTNFQSERLGWLKYFLSPMQDGTFFDNGHYRPLGRAIFVFIGGTATEFEGFPENQHKTDSQKAKEFNAAKGPDFVSRLRGYVLSPDEEKSRKSLENVVKRYAATRTESKPLSLAVIGSISLKDRFANDLGGFVDIRGPNRSNDSDRMFTIRRAILLRSMLERRRRSPAEEIDIDDDVLNGLLCVPRFHHSARSLEAILAMSAYSTQGLTKQTLPRDDQLKLHVDVDKFYKYVVKPVDSLPGPSSDPSLLWRYETEEWLKLKVGNSYDPSQLS